jgi:DNA repair ATPase RecN
LSELATSGIFANVQYGEYNEALGYRPITAITYSRVKGSGTKGYGGGGGGGGGGGEKAKPQQDPFYNYIKNVEKFEKEMERLQDEMELLFKPEDVFANYEAQEDYFKQLLGSNQSYLNEVNKQIDTMQKEGAEKWSKYLSFDTDGSLNLTEEYFNLTGDVAEEIDAWIDSYDDLLGRQDDLNSEVRKYKQELTDMFNEWRDEYIDMVDEIAEILKERDEKALEEKEKYY